MSKSSFKVQVQVRNGDDATQVFKIKNEDDLKRIMAVAKTDIIRRDLLPNLDLDELVFDFNKATMGAKKFLDKISSCEFDKKKDKKKKKSDKDKKFKKKKGKDKCKKKKKKKHNDEEKHAKKYKFDKSSKKVTAVDVKDIDNGFLTITRKD